MTGKRGRRAFEIDMPDAAHAPRATLVGEPRRGPMATAIAETSSALDERRAAEAAIRAENDALAAAHARARRLGLVVEMIPLDQISATKLMRDRTAKGVETDLEELKESLRAVGLSNPIRVEVAGEGAYELIQGLRRLTAYRSLLEETGDEAWAAIPASLTQPGETTEALYRRMVDENLVRKDVSFAEMALLARAYMDDPDTGCVDLSHAIKSLYGSASYQKRSYIRSFAEMMDRLDKYLEHPEAISRNLGLSLRGRMAEVDGLSGALQRALREAPRDRTAEEETRLLRRFADGDAWRNESDAPPRARTAPAGETRFVLKRPTGDARCKAREGRVEIKGPEDFSRYSQADLKRAVRAFYDALD